MVLLAYTIFTTTLVLQRKEASRGLALGLASLTVPLAPYLLFTGPAGSRRRSSWPLACSCSADCSSPACARLPERAVSAHGGARTGHVGATDGTLCGAIRPADPLRPSRPIGRTAIPTEPTTVTDEA